MATASGVYLAGRAKAAKCPPGGSPEAGAVDGRTVHGLASASGGAVASHMLRAAVLGSVIVVMTKVEIGIGCDGLTAAPADGLACSDYGLPVLAELAVVVSVPALGGGLAGHEMTVAIAPQLVEPVAAKVVVSRAAFAYRNTKDPPGLSK